MNFFVDMPVGASVARWLREKGHNAVHALEVGLDRADDDTIVNHARSDGRIIITLDLDYPRLIALSGQSSPGLILFRDEGVQPQEICRQIGRILTMPPPEDLAASIVVVAGGVMRVRSLPV
jgi:predicted nuclease of predicted toxin-antitoxin system